MPSSPQTHSISLPSLSHWSSYKPTAPLPTRLAMRATEIAALAAALFFLSTLVHRIVHSFDDVSTLLGRQARSPYAAIPWGSVSVAVVLLLVWHVALGRLSYMVVLEEEGVGRACVDKEARDKKLSQQVSWGRVLGRIVIPGALVVFVVGFGVRGFGRVATPMPVIVAGRSEGEELAAGGYGVR